MDRIASHSKAIQPQIPGVLRLGTVLQSHSSGLSEILDHQIKI
jgi:hypothetical protein